MWIRYWVLVTDSHILFRLYRTHCFIVDKTVWGYYCWLVVPHFHMVDFLFFTTTFHRKNFFVYFGNGFTHTHELNYKTVSCLVGKRNEGLTNVACTTHNQQNFINFSEKYLIYKWVCDIFWKTWKNTNFIVMIFPKSYIIKINVQIHFFRTTHVIFIKYRLSSNHL